jgi:hypothetical protein
MVPVAAVAEMVAVSIKYPTAFGRPIAPVVADVILPNPSTVRMGMLLVVP